MQTPVIDFFLPLISLSGFLIIGAGFCVGFLLCFLLLRNRTRAHPSPESQIFDDLGNFNIHHLDLIRAMIVVIDHNEIVRAINRKGCELLGYSKEEIIGKNWFDHFLPEDIRKEIRQFFHDIFNKHIEFTEKGDNSVLTKSGAMPIISWQNSLLKNENGDYVGVICSGEDITDKRNAETKLSESRRILQKVLNTIPVRVFWKDVNYRYLGCNLLFAQDAGYKQPRELIGKSDEDMAWKAQTPIYRKGDHEVLTTGKSILNAEEPQVGIDGKRNWLRTSKTPLRDEQGDIIGVLGCYENITDFKDLEIQFRQAQKMEAIGQLAGGIAHDFNNILVAILGYSDLALLEIDKNHPSHDKIQEIMKAGQRAEALTRQLLTFSRKQKVQQHPINLNDLFSETEKMLYPLIGEQITLKAYLGDDLWTIHADRSHIEQVVINLAVNARDAMQEGGNLIIETKNVELGEEYASRHFDVTPGPYVMLAVSDNGTGIDPETKEKIFEPFFTTKDQGKGTGLGLSTVYGIVKKNQGHIWVYSEIGEGTTFKLYFPKWEEEGKRKQRSASNKATRGSETILVVEDEEHVRNMIAASLESAGYAALQAPDGKKALEIFEAAKESIPLVITDMVMPGMSGKKLSHKISEAYPDTRFLFMSGYTDESIFQNGYLKHGVNFLQKPFTSMQVLTMVREILDHV